MHLLQGGGAVHDIPADATAFGCRDWDFACVITGIWARDQDGTELARRVTEWVYRVSRELLPMSNGVYSADLGPDPRDAELAIKAFGPTRPKLERLKGISDPSSVLAYACPLGKLGVRHKLIVLVAGESGAGKDHCARIWASAFNSCTGKSLQARTVSISDVTKKEYALLHDRVYKEKHRSALTAFFHDQLKRRPQLLEERFLDVVYLDDADVLLITGMREEAPLAAYSHLVPERRLIEVRVQASKPTRQARRGWVDDSNEPTADDHSPTFTFDNEQTGDEVAYEFARDYLFTFLDESRQQLADMVRPVPGFPRPGINFRHVLVIAQQPGGLKMVTSLLGDHLSRIDAQTSAIACCEAGGFIFASALAADLNIPLALIREAGKLPPPTISVAKPSSYISSSTSSILKQNRIEMERGLVPRNSSVMVVDDVLATGKTLCAVLQLLEKACISLKNISVVAVAEFPAHHGR